MKEKGGTPSFCFPFKIPDDPTATIIHRWKRNKLSFFFSFLQRSGSALAAAPGTLEEKLKELEKSKDYSTGLNNLVADNVDLPKNSTVKLG